MIPYKIIWLKLWVYSFWKREYKFCILSETCTLSAISGSCYGRSPCCFFNLTTSQCEWFCYHGCDGNRFSTFEKYTRAHGKYNMTLVTISIYGCIGCSLGTMCWNCRINSCSTSKCPTFPSAICEVDKCTNYIQMMLIFPSDLQYHISHWKLLFICFNWWLHIYKVIILHTQLVTLNYTFNSIHKHITPQSGELSVYCSIGLYFLLYHR